MEEGAGCEDAASSSCDHPSYFQSVSYSSNTDLARVTRLVLEALELAFFLCNILLDCYDISKIYDLLNQILPTAYVCNTGYWPLYFTEDRQSICVCERFGIVCRHRKNDFHFLDMTNIVENNTFSPESGGNKFFPEEVDVRVSVITTSKGEGYRIAIDLVVRHLTVREAEFVLLSDERFTSNINSNYYFLAQRQAMEPSRLEFIPHPLGLDVSSSYFEGMHKFHAFLFTSQNTVQIPRSYTLLSKDMPAYTLVYDSVQHSAINTEQKFYTYSMLGTSPRLASRRSKPYLHMLSDTRDASMFSGISSRSTMDASTSTDVENPLEGNGSE